MPTIRITLPADRAREGELRLLDDAGAMLLATQCLGRSDNTRARKAGNPDRNPVLPFGDTPTGTYTIEEVRPMGEARSFGAHHGILLTPVSGDALTAHLNGRRGLAIHGGALVDGGRLRPTYGCVRLKDRDMKRLLELLEQHGRPSLVEIRHS